MTDQVPELLRDKLASLKWHFTEGTVNREIIFDLIDECQRLTRPTPAEPVAQVREALEQIIETDDLGHCATLARDALAALTARPSDAAVAWLIEWPEDDNVPVRWWNPVYGWMRDANRAVHFERQSDAEDYITSSNWAAGVRATQHKFGLALPPDEPARVTEMKLVYIKRWRTIVPLPATYADEIVEALRITPSTVGGETR